MSLQKPLAPTCVRCGGPVPHAQGASGACEDSTRSSASPGNGTLRMRARGAGGDRIAATVGVQAIPKGMKIFLEVVRGPFCGNSFHVDRGRVVIGREEGDIRIPDPMMSRRHASLEVLDGDTVLVRDLSSTNGTYHNEDLIAFCKVKDGDEIRLGKTLLTVAIDHTSE